MTDRETDQKQQILWRSLAAVTGYFMLFVGLLFLIMVWAPDFFRILPFGGVANIEDQFLSQRSLNSGAAQRDMFEVVSTATTIGIERLRDAVTLFFGMLGSVLIMLPVAWVYRAINAETEYDHSLGATVILLPPVLAGIVLVVQHSLALAFSLAGIAAAVRFRRALIDTTDTLFIFVAIAVGIAAGVEALDIALVLSIFFCLTALLLCLAGERLESDFRTRRRAEKRRLKEQEHQQQAPLPPESGQ